MNRQQHRIIILALIFILICIQNWYYSSIVLESAIREVGRVNKSLEELLLKKEKFKTTPSLKVHHAHHEHSDSSNYTWIGNHWLV